MRGYSATSASYQRSNRRPWPMLNVSPVLNVSIGPVPMRTVGAPAS